MKRYLLVPTSPSSIAPLVERARELAFEERGVTFALVTPRPVGVADPDVADHLAGANEVLTLAQLRRRGLRVDRAITGDPSPVWAIEDELRSHRHEYDAVILASPVPRVRTRLLGRDAHSRADALPVQIIHVFEGDATRLPRPLTHTLRRIASQPSRFAGWVAALLRRPRLGLLIMMLPALVYLTGGLGLALFVNRAFLITEALALVLYTAMITAVVVLERTEERPLPAEVDQDRERVDARQSRRTTPRQK